MYIATETPTPPPLQQSLDQSSQQPPPPPSTSASRRSRSLFQPIPPTRTCAEADIEPHWCVCLSWQPIADHGSEIVMKLARAVVDAINRHTEPDADKCARLYVHRVTWAAKLSPQDNLLRFRRTNDGDGFLADLADRPMTVASELYQVKLIVRPGDAIYEASVTQRHRRPVRRWGFGETQNGAATTDDFEVDMAQVSRVNKYGEQAACIMEANPELRKFCNCRARGDE